jgi:uncharacterized repeat protein (TIGR01451 family)
MSWDTGDGSATIGGSAAGKVSSSVSYEDSGKTLVLDVTSNFAAGEQVTVSGLSFTDFLYPSAADNLELEVDNGGTVAVVDDKTITVTSNQPGCVADPVSTMAELRAAVADPDCSTINILPGTYLLTSSGSGHLDVSRGMTIRNTGGGQVTIWGVGSGSGVFFLKDASGPVLLEDLTISGGEAADGAGVSCENSTLTIDGTTISGSTVNSKKGGGVFVKDCASTIVNSTISNNSLTSSGTGGGIYAEAGSLTLTNVTIAANSAATSGGGLYAKNLTVTLENTIIADNSAPAGPQYILEGSTFTSNAHNLVEGGCPECDPSDLSSDPNLGPLADNGGVNWTHALQLPSPAIDAALNADAPATDQRGVTRPQGSDSDIGAYEAPGTYAISGTVFEDVDYGGGSGRDLSTSGGVARPGAKVELYDAAGAFVDSISTGVMGEYSFGGLLDGSYQVRVVNSSVTSIRPGYVAGLLPVQTIRTQAAGGVLTPVTNKVGGEIPHEVDPGINVTDATLAALNAVAGEEVQSLAPVTLSGGDMKNVDFGFNFSTIVNTNDQGQGSLRQFIHNANALDNTGLAQAGLTAGIETSIFEMPTTDPGYSAAPLSWTTTPDSAFVGITDPIIIDGTTQSGFSGTPIIVLDGSGAGAGVDGLMITAGGSTIRGLVIHSYTDDGIDITGAGSNTVVGNYIGTGVTGQTDLGNDGSGVFLYQSTGNTIGGTSPGDGNLISGNDYDGADWTSGNGIMVYDADANTIQGNFLGTNADGTGAIPNDREGVSVANSIDNLIGGGAENAGNLISGNGRRGIIIGGGGTTGNQVQGNLIGTQADGVSPLGNAGDGIAITNTASDNSIGGINEGEGNTVAHNGEAGVEVLANSYRNEIRGNSIFDNGGIGIDLSSGGSDGDGVTNNDDGDPDSGGNYRQNYPVLSSAVTDGSSIRIQGTINSTSSATFTLEFFNSAAADPSGNGEGKTYLGSADVTTDGSGDASIDETFVAVVPVGAFITSTATDATGNTSEFSNAVEAAAPRFVVDTNSDVADGDTTSIANLLADKGADGFISLREAMSAANQTPNGAVPDSITFDIGAGGVQTITPATALPVITEAVIIDGTTQSGFAGSPIIEISGATMVAGYGLEVTAGGSTIRGLVINRFATGIALTGGSGHTIVGNYLGLDVTGAVGNVGNTQEGLLIVGARANVIGGSDAADRNVISGNRLRGIWIDDFSDGAPAISDANQIYGNYIGTNATGTAALPYGGGATQQIGIAIWDGPSNVIGGNGLGNVLSGNAWYGLYIWGPNGGGNEIKGNIVGMDAAGSNPVGNGSEGPTRSGIYLSNTPGNTVGGTGAGEANTIAGNDAIGIVVSADGATGNTISGNAIYNNAGIGIDLGVSDGVTPNDSGDGDTGPNDLLNFPFIESVSLEVSTDTVEVRGFARPGSVIEFFVANPDPTGFGEGQVYVTTLTEGSADDLDSGTGSYTHAQAGSDDTNRFRFRIDNPGPAAIGGWITATATDAGNNTSEFSYNVQVVEYKPLFFSSDSDQTFWVGKAPTAISPITIGDGAPESITAANDIRIRIPGGFDMLWDTLDLSASVTGTANGKVSSTVAYEDAGATLVLDVTSDFVFGDTIVISDLSFMEFTSASGPDNLELELNNDDAVSASDDRTVEILAPGTPEFYSEEDQSFRVGDPPQSISRITVRADAAAPTITAANDLRIRIPAGFNMRWSNDNPATILGTAAGKVSSTVSYEDGGETLVVDVLTDFDPGDMITIEGLSFRSFQGASLEDNLELEVYNDGTVIAEDPQIIFIIDLDAPTISSSQNQSFLVGQGPGLASAFRISATEVISQITADDDIRVRIPAGIDMVWDPSRTPKFSGPGKNNVSATVSYEDGGKTLVIDVLTDFDPEEHLIVRWLGFMNFASASSLERLELEAFNDGVVSDTDDKTKRILGSIFRVDVWPTTITDEKLPSNGTNYTVQFTVTNIGDTTDDFDLLTSTTPGGVITVLSMAGLDVSQGADPDSARISNLAAGDSRVVTVTYSVGQMPIGTTDTLVFLARPVSNPTQTDDGRLELTVARPQINLDKAVNPNGTAPPGTDLTYTVDVTNGGSEDAMDLIAVDSLPAETEFQVGSASNTLPPGVTVVVEYSDDGGSTWTYTPLSGACGAAAGYDLCVNRIRWRFQNPLSSTAPDNVAQFQYVTRIR